MFFSARNGSHDMKQKIQRARRRTRRRGYFFPGDSMKSDVLAELVRDLERKKSFFIAKREVYRPKNTLNTPLLNGPINKNRVQRSGILHIVRDP